MPLTVMMPTITLWRVCAVVAALVVPPVVATGLFFYHNKRRGMRHRSATVLVLGDIGRSPRMMYHAESLARAGWETHVVGYGDTTPIPSLLETPRVHLHHLRNPPPPLLALPWVLRAPIRIAYQLYSVMYICTAKIPYNTEILLIQNPPSIPTLLLAQVISRSCTSTKLFIDWHNTGYSILAMRVGPTSPLVRVAKWFERTFGRVAYCHLFVTQALKDYLVNEWHLKGKTVVLHDRPPSQFRRTEVSAELSLFRRLQFDPPLPPNLASVDIRRTAFTELTPQGPALRPDRPAFVFSSTSWTADEDFSVLIIALDAYQAAKLSGKFDLPGIAMVITGKGALRAPFEAEVAKRENAGLWPDVCVRCAFLSARDYPLLLGCGDLGISMHQSSSGRDLPMKVVDMFGCGLPVLARGFACIDELVKDGRNGRVFNSGQELGAQLIDTLAGFPNAPKLDALKGYFKRQTGSPSRFNEPGKEEEWSSWDDNWDAVMKRGVLDFRRS